MIKKIMQPKSVILSYCLFFGAVIINSFIYLFYDFMNNDVEPNVKIYGKTQLFITIIAVLGMIIYLQVKNKYLLISFSFIHLLSISALLFIQTVPAVLWFLFNGQLVAESPFDSGVTGSWLYGAYHVIIIAWGVFNYYQLNQLKKFRKFI